MITNSALARIVIKYDYENLNHTLVFLAEQQTKKGDYPTKQSTMIFLRTDSRDDEQ